MILQIFFASLWLFFPGILGFTAAATLDDRAADAAAIRAHIESIFQAFIDGDVDRIYATHSEDWRGSFRRLAHAD
jgi:hypothetical protein